VQQAYDAALATMEPEDLLVIFGSFYLLAEVLNLPT
jgi:folylpolyglutamate synthase/dihydropteroate synthase